MTTNGKFGLGLLDRCPDCQSDDLRAVNDGRGTNTFCNTCGACWSVHLGWVRRVIPATCPGCELRDRCLAKEQASAADQAQLPHSLPT
jgi:hypothetical protein